jgi:hypothetical protein
MSRSKKSLAGKQRRISRKRTDRALREALSVVAAAPRLRMDVYEGVLAALHDYDSDVDRISRKLDPKAGEDLNAFTRARLNFVTKLNRDLAREFQRVAELSEDASFWKSVGGFFLGVATGACLTSKDVSR